MTHKIYTSTVFFLILIFQACTADKKAVSDKLQIVTTTGIIADAVKNIVGDKATVISIMGPGVDPHLYKATQGDLEKLSSADIVVYNGLHLEGKMGEVLEKLGRNKKVIAMSDGLDKNKLRSSPDFPGSYDPHIWFNVALWTDAIKFLANEIATVDKRNADLIMQNTATYKQKLNELHKNVGAQIAQIPIQQRTLITAHDAFGYFGDAYKIQVKGLQGISTVSEYGLQDVSNLVKFIVDSKIKAVFVESSVSPKAIDAVITGCQSKGHQIKIGGTLYSDALGNEGSKEGTYIGMVQHNVQVITQALK